MQEAIQPMAMYAREPNDISPDVRPLEHGAHLLDKQVPNVDRYPEHTSLELPFSELSMLKNIAVRHTVSAYTAPS